MRRTLASLAGGLAVALTLGVSAVAHAANLPSSGQKVPTLVRPADTLQGYGPLYDEGNGGYGIISGGALEFVNDGDEWDFYNVSIPITGQFEIQLGDNGCLAVDSSNGTVVEDTPTACALYGGDGYQWDRWNAINEGIYNGAQVWELKNAYGGECLYDYKQVPAVYTTCIATDHFEWFSWPDSNL